MPLSQIKATFPVLRNPANRHRAVGFTPEQWQYAFANTFSDEESGALYDRYHIPASGPIFWGSALANIHPGEDDNHVDYRNDDRAPLLFISGTDDHLMPPSIQQSNAKHYKSDTITEVKEFPSHGDGFLPAPVRRIAAVRRAVAAGRCSTCIDGVRLIPGRRPDGLCAWLGWSCLRARRSSASDQSPRPTSSRSRLVGGSSLAPDDPGDVRSCVRTSA